MKRILPLGLFVFYLLLNTSVSAQTPQGCNQTAIRNAFAATGHYTELVVSGQPCSLYFVDTQSKDAAQAESDAQTLGAHTVVFNDVTENTNVVNALNAGGWLASGNPLWLGYHRTGPNDGDAFITLDGTPLGFTNWSPGEPNNTGRGGGANSPSCYTSFSHCTFCSDYRCNNGEQCVQIYSSGQWNDLGCDQTSQSLVEVNLCPLINGSSDTALCSSSTLNLTTTTLLGSQPYTYSWSPGGQTTSSISVTPTVTTAYAVTVTDRYSCNNVKTINVAVANVATPGITANPTAVCANQNTTINYTGTYSGTAVFHWGFSGGNVTGASAPYTVSWPTSGTKAVTLYVTDQGCTSTTATTSVNVNSTPVANAGPDVQICSGGAAQLGVAPVNGVTYSWSPTVGLSNPGASNPMGGGVNPGTTTLTGPYVLTASANNCTATDTTIVTLYAPISNSFTVSPGTLCTGDNATITYTGTNSPSATYTWSFAGGNVVSGSGQGPYTVNWSTAGNPTVTLSVNENNCTVTAGSQPVTVNGIPVADAGPDAQFCSGASTTIGVAPVNGVTYSWSPTVGLSSSSVANPTVGGTNPTSANVVQNYTVTASANGCSATDVTTVTMYAPIVTTFTVTPSSVCINTNTTITYTGTNSAGATYTWNFAGGNVVSGSGQGPYTVNWSTASNPNVTLNVTENSCPGTATTQVVNVGNPPTADAGPAQTVCSGGTIQIGTIALGGTVTYSWSPATSLDNAAVAQPNFSASNTTTSAQVLTYTVTSNDNGCTASSSVNITLSAPVSVAILPSGPLEFCDGGNVTLSLSAIYTTYAWSDGTTGSTITPAVGGPYAVSTTDVNGCQFIGTPVTVVVDPLPTVTQTQLTDEQCYGEHDGSVTVAGAGTNPPFNYAWNTTPAQNLATASNLAPGAYTVIVTDSKTCTVSGTYTIASAPLFALVTDSFNNVSCYGRSDGSIYVSVQGGTPAFIYHWSDGKSSLINKNLVAGDYTLTATDNNGCSVTDSVTITQPASFTVTTSDSLIMKFGEQKNIELTVLPTGSYTYHWSPEHTLTCADCANPTSVANQTTAYTVTITDASGCADTTVFTLLVLADKKLFIPNVFTPNGDGANDELQVFTEGDKFFHFSVFNRIGEKVFESYDPRQGWDGKYHGTTSPPGSYVYYLIVEYLDGDRVTRTGAVTLLK